MRVSLLLCAALALLVLAPAAQASKCRRRTIEDGNGWLAEGGGCPFGFETTAFGTCVTVGAGLGACMQAGAGRVGWRAGGRCRHACLMCTGANSRSGPAAPPQNCDDLPHASGYQDATTDCGDGYCASSDTECAAMVLETIFTFGTAAAR